MLMNSPLKIASAVTCLLLLLLVPTVAQSPVATAEHAGLTRTAVGPSTGFEGSHVRISGDGFSVIGPRAVLHYTPNANFNGSTYAPGAVGFNLADISSAGALSTLPTGVKGLVYLGDTSGNTSAFRSQLSAFLPVPANLFGFYVTDEPIPSSVPASNLAAEVGYIHHNFPGIYCFVVLYNTGSDQHPSLGGYTANTTGLNTSMDLVGLDPYPFQTQFTGGADLQIINARVNVTLAGGWKTDQLVPVYQAFGNYDGDDYTVPTVSQLIQDLGQWQPLTPTPVFDFAYSWGVQDGDTALVDLLDLQAIFHQLFVSYPVTFSEAGLPLETPWSIAVDAAHPESTAPADIGLRLENGSYEFTVTSVAGFVASPAAGNLTVNGNAVNQSIMFTPNSTAAAYAVVFTEAGLPSGTEWYVNVTGAAPVSSTGTTATVDLANGTYSYGVASVNPRYVPTPRNGTLDVNGTTLAESVTFSSGIAVYNVTFFETGLPSTTLWSVTLAGTPQTSSSPTIAFSEPNGSYVYLIGAIPGYLSRPANGSVLVDGQSATYDVVFARAHRPVYFPVAFEESGLPNGTTWAVTLNQTSRTSSSRWLNFTEVNGSFVFEVEPVAGYLSSPNSGSVNVSGVAVLQSIAFETSPSPRAANGSSAPPTFLGLPPVEGYAILGGVALVAILSVMVALARRGRTGLPPKVA